MIVVHVSERSTIVEEVAPVVADADATAEAPAAGADTEKKES
jgi:hypothetical protein